ncbi:alpha/beta hydrolase [Stieleria sp. JC731]|uniref:alpha/beta hydrolase family protein n=1 Tax=Pirellulaceae TaxID=2691357 RepID=UPI001E3BD48F|nr:alpha/beta fold hydrolase [Stieleria sp. JC731]MCC9602221.1 alpha/beta hydrolase [Stieleria sp. JC731]
MRQASFETTSYRVKFSDGSGRYQLAGIIDRPKDWASGPDAREEANPVVVFSHCFTCSKDLKATVRICRALAKSGIGVLRFDMTGLGGSEGEFSESNFSTNLADLASAIRFATGELGRVTGLVGHSFGGIASLVTASRASQASQHHFPELAGLAMVATLAAPSDSAHLASLLQRMNPAIIDDGVGEVTIGGIRWTITKQMLEDFRSHQVADLLTAIECPVLLMHSPVDETVAFDHALRLMSLLSQSPSPERYGSANAAAKPVSLVSLLGADHLLATNPDDLVFVSDLVASWCWRYRS